MFSSTTLIDLLQWRALHQPQQKAYTFLSGGDSADYELTYAELDQKARAIAALLQATGTANERVMLLFPPGLEFILSFFGCLYAGAIAIPVYPPRPGRTLSRLEAIADDADASVALTTANVLFKSKAQDVPDLPTLQKMRWLAVDEIPDACVSEWVKPKLDVNSLAYLQYTSGSTSLPKGVMINHANVVHNANYLKEACHYTPDSISMVWLPHFHDLGLIAGILLPLEMGIHSYLMAPAAFLERPFRWLDAISRFSVTHTAAPNFAFDLCVRKITAEQRATLELSSWQVAINGAEPVRAESLDRFSRTFMSHGFRRTTFFPCYGLAEATLLVCGARAVGSHFARRRLQTSALQQNRIVETSEEVDSQFLVSCGGVAGGMKVVIVNPETLIESGPGDIGEIWVSGESVSSGYWNRPVETEQTFKARRADTGAGPFLRTGDSRVCA